MHKKDINDRMSSLAFKMEKVYNLDKKKGPAAEVYKYFKSTIDQDSLIWETLQILIGFEVGQR